MSSKNTPNTLIIYIKTRIPNYYKITYDPSMTIPTSKSHTVYFNPLVKYYASIVKNPPFGAPPETKFTQFFEIKQFETMINRILSDFRYMQDIKNRTLNDATNEKIIDNNIKITLETLFARNTPFYLKDIPYTIVNYKWKTGHWNVDIKPIDKLINPYLPVSGKEIENAQKELDDIPEENRQGIAAAATLANDINANIAASGLKPKLSLDMSMPTKAIAEKATSLLEDANVVKNMITGIKNLYGKYLQKNEAVNLENTQDLIRDPLTFSFLVNRKQLEEYFDTKTDASNKTLELYGNYINSRTLLTQSETKFSNMLAGVGLFKQEFNSFAMSLPKISFAKDTANDITFQENITKMNDYKIQFMSKLYDLYQSLIEIFNAQKVFFASLVFLLEDIKKNYNKINLYYKKPEIAIKCMDLDIATLNSFINLDPNNNNSVSYFDNIKRANNLVNLLASYQNEIANNVVNYDSEFEQMKNNSKLLEIERSQYEIYLLRCVLLYHYNQLDTWKNYYDSIVPFVNEIATHTNTLLVDTDEKLIHYNKTYSPETQKKFLEFYKIDGIRLFIDKNKNKKWRLVNSKGEKAIRKDKNVIKFGNKDFLMEKEYIELVKGEIECYDLIMLYTYLLEVQCLRQGKVYTAEENVYQVEYEACNLLKNYFNAIKDAIDVSSTNIYIPKSLMWDTTNFDSVTFINSKIQTNYASITLYGNKISDIHKSIIEITKHCEELHKSLELVNENNVTKQCNQLLSKSITSMPEYKTRSNYWIKKEIKNYDVRKSMDLNYNITQIVNDAYDDGIIDTSSPEYYQDWGIYDNEGGGDCFFASVRDALNGQLDLLGAETTNMYTEKINDEKRFTITSLRKIVSDNFTLNDYNFYLAMLGEPNEKGEFDLTDELTRMAYKLLIDNTRNAPQDVPKSKPVAKPVTKPVTQKPKTTSKSTTDLATSLLPDWGQLFFGGNSGKQRLRDFDEVKEVITQPCTYWADELAIQYIQNTLKIMFIIFNMVPRPTGSFVNGDTVIHKPTGSRHKIAGITYVEGKQVFTLEDKDGAKMSGVGLSDIEMYGENLPSRFRIECPVFDLQFQPKHFIFIAKTQLEDDAGNTAIHYELVRNTGIGMYVYDFSQIPDYIKYFMYENCYKYLDVDTRGSIGFSVIKEFRDLFQEFEEKTKKISPVDIEDPLFAEHERVYKKLTDARAALSNLKSIEEQDEVVDKDIANTQLQVDMLEEQLSKINEDLIAKFGQNGGELFAKGGAPEDNIRPSEKYYDYGAPSRGYVRRPYYNQGYYSIPPMMYNTTSNIPYEEYINKMKEQSSKTAYYINVDLELYPGTSITTGQKLEAKCQSAFENIREAYADMFGYEYRPGQLTQAYAYEAQVKKEKEKEKEKEQQKNNLTNRLRGGLYREVRAKTHKRK